jgi:hypothetical protein
MLRCLTRPSRPLVEETQGSHARPTFLHATDPIDSTDGIGDVSSGVFDASPAQASRRLMKVSGGTTTNGATPHAWVAGTLERFRILHACRNRSTHETLDQNGDEAPEPDRVELLMDSAHP